MYGVSSVGVCVCTYCKCDFQLPGNGHSFPLMYPVRNPDWLIHSQWNPVFVHMLAQTNATVNYVSLMLCYGKRVAVFDANSSNVI